MCNKLTELHQLLSTGPAIVVITETWLDPSITDNVLVDCHNYSVYRKDRKDGYGGVCILVNNHVFHGVSIALPDKYDDLEIVSVDLLNLQCKCRIIATYRPPSPNTDANAIQYCLKLSECIDSLFKLNSTVILCGDFNVPHLKFNDDSRTCSGILSDIFTRHGLTQFVSGPTRYSDTNNTASTLDLVLCNDINFIYNTNVGTPFSLSDHCMIHFDILDSSDVLENSDSVGSFDFKHADWAGILNFLNNIDFMHDFDGYPDVADQFNYFYRVLNESIVNNVPFINCRNRKHVATRYPANIRRQLTRKKAAWRKYKLSRSGDSLKHYKLIASRCRSMIYSYISNREKTIVESDNLTKFYRYCNRKFTNKSVIGPLKSPDGSLILKPREKANLFQQTFANYYTLDNGYSPEFKPLTNSNIDSIIFTPSLVKKAIQRLRIGAKGGPDKIPTEFVKRCSLWLTSPLSFLFQRSFNESFFPAIWSTSIVSPIFKKGDPTDPSNYRPISLSCIFGKLMEHVIKDQLVSYLLSRQLISKQQHAFIVKHSTTSNLLECTRNWTVALNNKKTVDVIYIDYRRAFDSIVHNKLLIKLRGFGVDGLLYNWIEAFLYNRTQRVCIENCLSDPIPVTSGIIQGSVLGPILFILYVNDVASFINCSVDLVLFADDLKLFSSFDFSFSNSQSVDLQAIIDNIYTWSCLWQLTVNTDKCTSLRLSNQPSATASHYCINNIQLSHTSNTRDLGIIIDNKLSYNCHIESICNKAAQRSGILFRGFVCRDQNFLRKAYITYIRPLVEYSTIIWNPVLKKHIDSLEKIQRKFTKRIPSLKSLPYLQRLKALNLETLELRRLYYDLTYYYKILHDLTPHKPEDFFTFHYPPPNSRDPQPLIMKPIRGSKKLFSSFSYRAVNCYNSLPINIKNQNSLLSFKRLIRQHDLTSFLYGSCHTNLCDFNDRLHTC